MAKVVADMERICRLRSWRDELVLSAMHAREKGYSHTADALDKILRDEFDLIALDSQAIANSIGLNSQNENPFSPDSTYLAKLEDSEHEPKSF